MTLKFYSATTVVGYFHLSWKEKEKHILYEHVICFFPFQLSLKFLRNKYTIYHIKKGIATCSF